MSKDKLEKSRENGLFTGTVGKLKAKIISLFDINNIARIDRLLEEDLLLQRVTSLIPGDALEGDILIEIKKDETLQESLTQFILDIELREILKRMYTSGFRYGDAGLFPVVLQPKKEGENGFNYQTEINPASLEDINIYSRAEIYDLTKQKSLGLPGHGKVNGIKLKLDDKGIGTSIHDTRFYHYQYAGNTRDKWGKSIVKGLRSQINVERQTREAIGINAFRNNLAVYKTSSSNIDKMKDEEKKTGVSATDRLNGSNFHIIGKDDAIDVLNGAQFDSETYYKVASMVLCVALGIPLSRWLGTQQGAVSGSQTDIVLYKQLLENFRVHEVRKAVRFIIDIKLKELGKDPSKIDYKIKFGEIIPPDPAVEAERENKEADTRYKNAQAFKTLIDAVKEMRNITNADITSESLTSLGEKYGVDPEDISKLLSRKSSDE